jgi:antitoxin component of MazEF toxin-antitoxin module
MITKLSRHGEHAVLILEQEILDQLNIDVETPLNVETEGEMLIIFPIRDAEHRQKFQEALDRTNRTYNRMLQRLAE